MNLIQNYVCFFEKCKNVNEFLQKMNFGDSINGLEGKLDTDFFEQLQFNFFLSNVNTTFNFGHYSQIAFYLLKLQFKFIGYYPPPSTS